MKNENGEKKHPFFPFVQGGEPPAWGVPHHSATPQKDDTAAPYITSPPSKVIYISLVMSFLYKARDIVNNNLLWGVDVFWF